MAELKAEIGTFGTELGDLLQELKENKVKAETDLEKNIDEMKDGVTTDLTAFFNGVFEQDLKPSLTTSLEAMSKDVTMVTDQCVSGIQSLTQKHDNHALDVNSTFQKMFVELSILSKSNDDIVDGLTEFAKETSDTLEAVADKVQYIDGITYVRGKVRIVNITTTSSTIGGRLEVYYSDRWGTVCDDLFNITDAKVACVSLGFPSAATFKDKPFFGRGLNLIWMDDLECTGVEQTLFDCEIKGAGKPGVHDCNHTEDVGVICNK